MIPQVNNSLRSKLQFFLIYPFTILALGKTTHKAYFPTTQAGTPGTLEKNTNWGRNSIMLCTVNMQICLAVE